MDDQIEAATFLLAGAITAGDVVVVGADEAYLAPFLETIRAAGVDVSAGDGGLRARGRLPAAPVEFTTAPYPSFPTDRQPQTMALATLAGGRSVVTEGTYRDRFGHATELRR